MVMCNELLDVLYHCTSACPKARVDDFFQTRFASPSEHVFPKVVFEKQRGCQLKLLRKLDLELGEDLQVFFHPEQQEGRHTGNQFLVLVAQTVVYTAHPDFVILTPFGRIPYELGDPTAHGFRRGTLIESVLIGTPLPHILALAEHSGWDKHVVYHIMQSLNLLPAKAALQAPTYAIVSELGGPLTMAKLYTAVQVLQNTLDATLVLNNTDRGIALFNLLNQSTMKNVEIVGNLFQMYQANPAAAMQLGSNLTALASLAAQAQNQVKLLGLEIQELDRKREQLRMAIGTGPSAMRFLPDHTQVQSLHASTVASPGISANSQLPPFPVPLSSAAMPPMFGQPAPSILPNVPGNLFQMYQASGAVGSGAGSSSQADPDLQEVKMKLHAHCSDACAGASC